MLYQVYHILLGNARGQSAARCGKSSVQLWQSERYIQQVSHVIQNIGLPDDYSIGTIRISLGKYNTEQEVKRIADILIKLSSL